MSDPTFELDLLDFHGEALELEFEIPGNSANWLVADDDPALRVEEDVPFKVELRAQLIGTTVHLDGFIQGSFAYKCGRCLQWRRIDLDESVDFVLMSRPSWEDAYGGEDEIVLQESDLDVSYYDEEIIDLRPLIREAVLLELPTFPVCPDALLDVCDADYEKIVGEETLEKNEENSIDLRWSKLKEIELGKNDS